MAINSTEDKSAAGIDLVAEFDRIVAGDCITDNIARHQEVISAIRAALRRSDLASPTQDGLTVEGCLQELREMYGETLCELRIRTQPYGLGVYIIDLPETPTFNVIYAETLAECMTAVRAWKLKEGNRESVEGKS